MAEQIDRNKAMIQAVKEVDLDGVRQLVEGGAEASCITAAVIPPMQETAEHEEIMRYLFTHGTDVNHNEFDEGTMLMFSAGRGQLKYLQLYLDVGADINLASAVNGLTGLQCGVQVNNLEVVRFFVQSGADVNQRCHEDAPTSTDDPPRTYGETALHFAASYADKEIIELLLEAGADKALPSAKIETPLDYARKRDRPDEILQLLR